MRKVVVTSALLASAATSFLGLGTSAVAVPTTCQRIPLAPKAENELRADSGCRVPAKPLSSQATLAATATVVSPTTPISSTPTPYDTTNGDILTITKVDGVARAELAIGGNFTAVVTPDGVSHAAKNFAVIDENTGAIIHAGNANSYVRTITSRAGTIYLGGDFTAVNGVARSHVAALNTSFQVTSLNPGSGSRVRALAVDSSGLYIGGDSTAIRKISLTGTAIWTKSASAGAVHAFWLTPDGSSILIGGLFESYDGFTQHGLIKASTATGARNTGFNAHLRPDSGTGTHADYDGEAAISFAPTPEGTNVMVGIGGYGADEIRKVSLTSGAQVWNKFIPADCQAVVRVGDTSVIGHHRNQPNKDVPYPYFGGQLETADGSLTSWDPKVTGLQSNADGGNGGIQAAYADSATKLLFLGGDFTQWNGTPHKSLIAFRWS